MSDHNEKLALQARVERLETCLKRLCLAVEMLAESAEVAGAPRAKLINTARHTADETVEVLNA